MNTNNSAAWNDTPFERCVTPEDMTNRIARSLVAFSLLLSCFVGAQGQTLDTRSNLDDPAVAETIRVKYVRSPDLPDGLAFLNLMQTIADANSADDRAFSLALIRSGMGLSESGSEEFLNHLGNVKASYEADYSRLLRRLACSPAKPVVGDEIYALFEALDDASVGLSTQHLAVMKAELGQELAARLQQWLDVRKLDITHVSVRYKEAYAQSESDAAETLASVCAGLAPAQ